LLTVQSLQNTKFAKHIAAITTGVPVGERKAALDSWLDSVAALDGVPLTATAGTPVTQRHLGEDDFVAAYLAQVVKRSSLSF